MLDEFISHNLTFEQVNEAFDLMHKGERYNTTMFIPYLCNY